MNSIFFPILTRRSTYSKKDNGNYYVYSHYYEEIEEDCQSRCVYCDSHKTELGGDNLQLDHFKPQNYFSDLKNEPTNLVLACPKCNRLKSNHWPSGTKHFFIDPFEVIRTDYMEVEETGLLTHLHVSGKYIIELLQLNRVSKQNLRLRRIIHNESITLHKRINIELKKLYDQIDMGELGREIILRKLKLLIDLSNETSELVDSLGI